MLTSLPVEQRAQGKLLLTQMSRVSLVNLP